jgi:hypothetical protein
VVFLSLIRIPQSICICIGLTIICDLYLLSSLIYCITIVTHVVPDIIQREQLSPTTYTTFVPWQTRFSKWSNVIYLTRTSYLIMNECVWVVFIQMCYLLSNVWVISLYLVTVMISFLTLWLCVMCWALGSLGFQVMSLDVSVLVKFRSDCDIWEGFIESFIMCYNFGFKIYRFRK